MTSTFLNTGALRGTADAVEVMLRRIPVDFSSARRSASRLAVVLGSRMSAFMSFIRCEPDGVSRAVFARDALDSSTVERLTNLAVLVIVGSFVSLQFVHPGVAFLTEVA